MWQVLYVCVCIYAEYSEFLPLTMFIFLMLFTNILNLLKFNYVNIIAFINQLENIFNSVIVFTNKCTNKILPSNGVQNNNYLIHHVFTCQDSYSHRHEHMLPAVHQTSQFGYTISELALTHGCILVQMQFVRQNCIAKKQYCLKISQQVSCICSKYLKAPHEQQ